MGVALQDLDRSNEAIAVYDELLSRFGGDRDPEIKETVLDARAERELLLSSTQPPSPDA